MTNVRALVSDPEFQKFPIQERVAALQQAGADPAFIDEYSKLPENSGLPTEPQTPWEKIKAGATNLAGRAVQGAIDTIPPGTIPGGFDAGVARAQDTAQKILQYQIPPEYLPLLSTNPITAPLAAGGGSLEGLLELAPAVGGAAGGAVANVPGAAAGASIGESVRQGVRGAAGLPQATGVGQRALDLDPNGPAASILAQVDEAMMTPIAKGVGKIVSAASTFTDNSALRDLLRLLKPAKAMDKMDALALAERMRSEGVASPLTSRLSQLQRAREILGEPGIGPTAGTTGPPTAPTGLTGQAQAAESAIAATGATVPAGAVEAKAVGRIPDTLPGGIVPHTGTDIRNAAEGQALDTMTVINNRSDIPFTESLAEKRRLDDILRKWYVRGGEVVPDAKEFVKGSADDWRHEIATAFPEFGDLELRQSDMITITELLEKAEYEARRQGLKTSSTHVFGMLKDMYESGFRSTGPIASLSSAGKTVLATILQGGGATAQAWLRAVGPKSLSAVDSMAPDNSTAPPPAAPAPAPSASPDEEAFINKYLAGAR
jgi:hypothetical protein